MKSIIIALLVAAVTASPHIEDAYMTEVVDYTKAPISEIRGLMDCVMYGKTCSPKGEAYRAVYPTIIMEACSKCSQEQKRACYDFFQRVENEIPHKLQEMKDQVDSQGKYFDAFYKVIQDSVNISNITSTF